MKARKTNRNLEAEPPARHSAAGTAVRTTADKGDQGGGGSPDLPLPDSALFADALYDDWVQDPSSVDPAWAAWFASLGPDIPALRAAGAPRPAGSPGSGNLSGAAAGPDGPWVPAQDDPDFLIRQGRVSALIRAFRDIGHLYSDLNPLKGYLTRDMYYRLFAVEGDYGNLGYRDYGLSDDDLDHVFYAGRFIKPENLPLRDIEARLRAAWCGTTGYEITHIQNRVMQRWFLERIEGEKTLPPWTNADRKNFYHDVLKAETLEHFIHQHYLGQKRFSLEGSEVLVPAMNTLIRLAAREGIGDVVLGMAHRGRLNVLANVLGKPAVEIFAKFEDAYTPYQFGGNGDVKYHMGYSQDWHDEESGRTVHLGLLANPSHLEAVDPVATGKARALQRLHGDKTRKKVLPVLIHGDSAFSGQGVVTETLNLSQLKGYRTGGTVHVLINNQIGFTTASRDSRSTFHATDTGKTIPMPIIHVNGDDVEAVCRAMVLALAFRQKFGYDVMVDILCYRRHGHNETDEASFTHPIMYQYIKDHPSVVSQYGQTLAAAQVLSAAEQLALQEAYLDFLRTEADRAKNNYVPHFDDAFHSKLWKGFTHAYSFDPTASALDDKTLDLLSRKLCEIPSGFKPHPKLDRIIGDRRALLAEGKIDWALGEALAFGSLVLDGHAVRLSGEDCQRGTFSHRHAVWWDHSTSEPRSYSPLQNLSPNQGVFAVYDSPLSEFAVLGFEYGYSLAAPDFLIMWEAQFGDFANGAQVIIDQFITSGETKWFRSSGLVMLLPHGYEGQGPEHSSAHVDRFLSRCAENNIQVCNPSNPAQLFHLLRRQVQARYRKPLVIFTPKSLLRHKSCQSTLDEVTQGAFRYVLDDPSKPREATTVLLCSGKVWYDLDKQRTERGLEKDVALVRMEQLYPFPEADLAQVLAAYPKAKDIRWVQEENKNYGPWRFVREMWDEAPGLAGFPSPRYVGRKASASPATGSQKQHQDELATLMGEAFARR